MPNLNRQPRNAISSKGICPVDRKATDSAPVRSLDRFQPRGENVQRRRPIRFGISFPDASRSSGIGRAVRRIQRIERLPAFRAGHAEIHRVARLRAEVDRLAVFIEVDFQLAAGRAVAADRGDRGARLQARRDFPEPEIARAPAPGRGSAGPVCCLRNLESMGWSAPSKQGACGDRGRPREKLARRDHPAHERGSFRQVAQLCKL